MDKKYDCIFLDRDGTINIDPGYISDVKNFKFYDYVFDALRLLRRLSKDFIIITNQSGVGRGYYGENDVIDLHNWINNELRSKGSQIDDFFYATYHKTSILNYSNYEKNLRKPNIGMINLAKRKWSINNKISLVIGDQISDIKMAKKANLKSILVKKDDDLYQVIKDYYKKLNLNKKY